MERESQVWREAGGYFISLQGGMVVQEFPALDEGVRLIDVDGLE